MYRIIPARAGFTGRPPCSGDTPQDHPRSRGVYRPHCRAACGGRGSSPLARGLPSSRPRQFPQIRIIPARAGFTRVAVRGLRGHEDHPRSRGVYRRERNLNERAYGSSPLARGLPGAPRGDPDLRRIIPARAGFTSLEVGDELGDRDHPRSRGVYATAPPAALSPSGSSPLARGLRRMAWRPRSGGRIIPARAGFTPLMVSGRSWPRDHPRSRGVYTCGSLESQRTRTLPDPGCLHCRPRARSAELR